MIKVRRKRCKECKELFAPKYSTLQIACSPSCAYAYSKRKQAETKKENSVLLAELEKEKKDRQGLTTLLESVKKACHRYIRERDKGKPCISCGNPYHSDHQAGHYFKAELYSNLRFHELNIQGQCVKCNIRLEGNLNSYSVNLPERIGEWEFNVLKSAAEGYKHENFKWDREELKKTRTQYNKKYKELKGNFKNKVG